MNIRNQMNGTGHGPGSNGHGPAPVVNRTASRPLFQSDCIWIDGELLALEEAAAQLLRPTLQYGVGLLEEIRCYATERGPGLFRLEAHLKRFLQGVKLLGVSDFRWTTADLRRAVAATVQANSFQSCDVRLMLTFDDGPAVDGYEPRLAIIAQEWRLRPGDARGQAARLMVSSFTPTQAGAGPIVGPNGQQNSAVRARSDARRAGCDEAVLLDAGGYVAACTGGTLFAVRDGALYTAPRPGVPQGISRDTAIVLAGDLGYEVVEERLSRDELYVADELFLCGTTSAVVPVREIDFRPVGDGQAGPVSAAIHSLYFETVYGRGARSAGWVEYVMMEPLF